MAHVPDNLPDGLANGQANLANVANIFTQLGATLGGQHAHNAATVTALTNQRDTLVNHSNLIDGLSEKLEEHNTSITTNKDDIKDVKQTVEANGLNFDSYMKLANLARAKNDAVVASNTTRIDIHAGAY